MVDGYTYHGHSSGNSSSSGVDDKLARDTSNKAGDNSSRIEKMEIKLENLSLITEALWKIVESTGINETELIEMIDKVKINRKSRVEEKLKCSKCNMSVPAKMEKCMYCGGELNGDRNNSSFDV